MPRGARWGLGLRVKAQNWICREHVISVVLHFLGVGGKSAEVCKGLDGRFLGRHKV